jgi:hypothetical protein
VSEVGAVELPDIYHIMLDGYGRQDILAERYGVDNEPFLQALEARGFRIARRAVANYMWTHESLASLFNFAYLRAGEDPWESLRENRLTGVLREHGYTVYSFESGFPTSDWMPVDERLGRRPSDVRHLLAVWRMLTPLPDMRRLIPEYEAKGFRDHRDRIFHTLGTLPETAAAPSPKFVFAHLVSPHPPFVIDERGEAVRNRGAYWPAVKRPEPDDVEKIAEYIERYGRQLRGLNALVLEMVEALAARTTRPSIIILQGDHGPGAHATWGNRAVTDLYERAPTLTAIRFPGEAPAGFTDDFSLVNTYRLILGEYFGMDVPLLETRCYFPRIQGRRVDQIDVTEEVLGPKAGGASAGAQPG